MGRTAAASLATLLMLGTGALPSWAEKPPTQAEQSTDGFGRWESPLSRCQLQWGQETNHSGASTGCLKLRLDQSIEGMLRVRFINAVGGSRFSSEELTFAGLLLKEDQPMRCRAGQCDPSWPLRLQVHGVASRRFDARGLARELPSNQLAKGSCRLGPDQLICSATGKGGQRWQASADIPTATPAKKPASTRP